jgi:vacuolar-type H+-ATPase subunit H
MSEGSLRQADKLLTELTEVVETARAVPMSASCVVPREHMLDLLDELREVLPGEIEEARTVLARRERLLQEAYENAAATRERAVAEADTVLADAGHQAEQTIAAAQAEAEKTLTAGREEHGRLVASTTVHQAAAKAAAALREDSERYQREVTEQAQHYDTQVRADADRYSHDARSEAERYATKLSVDAEDYAERTLDELAAVLHRSAQTAEQGRAALASRRAGAWAPEQAENEERPPISA